MKLSPNTYNLSPNHAKRGGFTLIEILVVIAIIAILAAIVLIAINPARQFAQARQTQRTSNVNAILNAVGQYMVDNNGNLPNAISTTTSNRQPISSGGANICGDIVPTYMSALPTDPASPHDGASINCAELNNTGYELELDMTSRRISVCAPFSLQETALGTTTEICVTR